MPSDLINKKLAELSTLSKQEKDALENILREIKESGSSKFYQELWDEDYEEIPVSIDTFIEDERYLGKALNHGASIYPYWRKFLREVFPDHTGGVTPYHEILLTGSIGQGKTFIAVICMTYVLYKLLCLKNPQRYYKLVPGSEIVIAFFNLTLDLAKGVAYQSFNELLLGSPWFMMHGTQVGVKNIEYIPDKNIKFIVGSQPSHALGNNVICLEKDTLIVTKRGLVPIKNIQDTDIIYYYNPDTNSYDPYEVSEDTLKITALTSELYEIVLEDGSTIKCTADHQLFTTTRGWVKAKDLSTRDELFSNEDFKL